MQPYENRHPATQQLMRYFSWSHLPTHLQETSRACSQLAGHMVAVLPDGPELTAGLRKLLEAKDCFVRAALDAAATEQQAAREVDPSAPYGTGEEH
ncbi:hypothetical protein [Kitasatospora sp. CB01950]|uniref:hypothetical protein n=1 Tax=Kitasatospora sp. CB01950 TaxID=1703930 RepID=UPI0009608616|nr:hypothetical protein [Kitasatospora sp. CB01950]OKJ06818.1 hypothetical protein AMK19_23490 [Kitasatospora sp. CB01950]